ncbi:TPA: KilA-N domain-containing protein [Acinetobacter baumannii]|nr:KilA-N domain-containing protein [Acinetobacter baumannii]HEN9568485.1 KilA-N domain-containing protein [Acinetobacter baumannii]
MNALIVPQHIKIDETIIRQDENGRYCINDLHKASGGEERNKPKFFLENKKTQELVQELTEGGNPTSPVEVIRGGLNQGTYVVKELVYSYAMWISAKFNLKVIRTFDQVVNASKQPQIPQTLSEALQLAADQARQLELAAPKVQYFDKVVDRSTLLNATQVAQKIGMSAMAMNKILDNLNVYSRGVKRARVFKQWFIDSGFGELKQTEYGFSQPMFTTKGEAWVIEKLVSEAQHELFNISRNSREGELDE